MALDREEQKTLEEQVTYLVRLGQLPQNIVLETQDQKKFGLQNNYLGVNHGASSRGWFGRASTESLWLSEAPNRRMAIQRAAYLLALKEASVTLPAGAALDDDSFVSFEDQPLVSIEDMDFNPKIHKLVYQTVQAPGQLKDLLTALSTGKIDKLRFQSKPEDSNLSFKENPIFIQLTQELAAEDTREYKIFNDTLTHAEQHSGAISGNAYRNKHLAEIITLFTYLYGPDINDNPVLSKQINGVFSHELLDTGIDKTQPHWRRQAIEAYMRRISTEIKRLIDMTPEELSMAFPEDDVKHKAIIQPLKRAFNRLSAEIGYHSAFSNLRNADKFNEKTNQYTLEKKDLKAGDAHVMLKNKQWMRKAKYIVTWIAFATAIIIAGGQVAIAVLAASGAMAVAIGTSAFLTNTLLFYRDMRGVIIAGIRWKELFTGMSPVLVASLTLFFFCALAAGIVTGGFVLTGLVSLTGYTLATASAGILVGMGTIALISIAGMTALFFMPGIGIAKALRGKSFMDFVSKPITAFMDFVSDPIAAIKYVFTSPDYNGALNKLQADVDSLKKLAMPAAQAELNTKQRELWLQKIQHNTRHVLKVIFSLVLIPAAIVATVIAAYAVSKASLSGTRNLLQSIFKMSDVASATLANFLTWGPSLAVNGTLTAKNLMMVSRAFAGLLAKVTTGIFYSVGMFGVLTTSGRFFKTIGDAFHAYRCNPYKNIAIRGMRGGFAIALGAAIALNGYGNGSALGQEGAFSMDWIPTKVLDWLNIDPATMAAVTSNMGVITTVVGTGSSIALNTGATVDFATDFTLLSTPLMNLENQYKPAIAAPAVVQGFQPGPDDHNGDKDSLLVVDNQKTVGSNYFGQQGVSPASGQSTSLYPSLASFSSVQPGQTDSAASAYKATLSFLSSLGSISPARAPQEPKASAAASPAA